ncbi:MAG: hypothetical protein LW841_08175 [Flammeovirgaceae bacterium]|jgi:hypothetical protein|nr:hypothetical protein [Flammeovirgaceae bacterium]
MTTHLLLRSPLHIVTQGIHLFNLAFHDWSQSHVQRMGCVKPLPKTKLIKAQHSINLDKNPWRF